MTHDTLGMGGSSRDGRGDDTTRRLVPGPAGRAEAPRRTGAHRGVVRDVGGEGARFHRRPAFAFVVDVWGAVLTAVALAGALLGSGCGAGSKPCSAWNGARAAACAVCALPECPAEVGAGGEVLVNPAELDEACEAR